MTTSLLGSQLDSICDGLRAVSALSGVNVYSGVVGVEEAGLECIAFGNGRLTETQLAMGGTRLETWEIGGEIRVLNTWAGDTEATIRAARDRALEIFGAIEIYLNDTYTSSLPDVNLTSAEVWNNVTAEGRECRLSFEFEIKAVKNP